MCKDGERRRSRGAFPSFLKLVSDSRVSFLLPCAIHNILDERDCFRIVVFLLRMAQCRTALCRRPDYSAKTTYTL